MDEKVEILEHEILKAIYIHTSFNVAGQGTSDGKFIPIFKRDHNNSTIHFGTLVDIVNNPSKYSNNKSVQEIIIKYEDVNDTVIKYKWGEVSDAVDVLELNEQVVDVQKLNNYGQCIERKVTLTKRGAIDYRNGFYIKHSETEEINTIKNTVTRIEYSLKKNWLRNEIIKFTITTVLGFLLGWLLAHIMTPQSGNQQRNQLQITGDTIIVK